MRKLVLQVRQKFKMVFSKAAKIWIVQNHLRIPGLTQLRRDYIAFFGITNKKSVPGVCAFKRVIEKFQTYGSVNDERTNNKRPNSLGDGDVQKIQNYFFENPKSSTRKASSNLKISKSSIHRTLKKTLKFRWSTYAQALSPEHVERREAACRQFLQQEEDWQRKVIWSDEKWF